MSAIGRERTKLVYSVHLPFPSELIEMRRVTDQDLLARCRIGRPDHELVHKFSIVDLE